MTETGSPAPPADDGSIVHRLLRRATAMQSERSARAVVAGLVDRPPATLRDLERLIGRLDVDLAGPEGRGGGVFRPASPFAPGGITGPVRLGRLRPGVVRTFVGFNSDPYHGQPRNAEQLRPNHVSVSVDLDRDQVRGALEQRFGAPRPIDRDGKEVEEFGRWYYLSPWQRPTSLEWLERRPDWALPSVAEGAAESFLAALVEGLGGAADSGAIATTLAPLAAAAGARIDGSGGQIQVSARPGLPLDGVAGAFGWDAPVAWSPDVHMSTWAVGPLNGARGGPARTRVGGWAVEAWLARGPGDAPVLDTRGPSYLYDMRERADPVATLLATAADQDGR
jgi:hypothetical protein